MQKTNYWIAGLLIVLIGINIFSFFFRKEQNIESLKLQNESLKEQLKSVKQSVDLIDANLKTQLNKVDSSIALSKQSITNIETNIRSVRTSINTLRQTDPDGYYNSLSKAEKEKLKKLIYQDVIWE